jgi:hypothetical protein
VILGWLAVGIAAILSSLWAFIGAYESFHEGWYFDSLAENLVLTAKYLGLPLIFIGLAAAALRLPRVGAILCPLFGIGFWVWALATRKSPSFNFALVFVFMTLPLTILGILFWLGRPRPSRRAYAITILLPVLVAAVFAAEPVTRIARRIDDGNRGMRIVQGNGLKLIWAPQGPGWPNPDPHDTLWITEWRGPTWEEAQRVSRYLSADGMSVASTPQNIWRLPTIEEAVRSMTRHGQNCSGAWDSVNSRASYSMKPDKESPLWNSHSVIIYLWTSSEYNSGRAFSIDFNGNTYRRNKTLNWGSQGFRAVRDSRND